MSSFQERMRVGPATLLLGQEYLALESAANPLTTLIERKYGLGDGGGLTAVMKGGFAEQGEAGLAWLDAQSTRLPRPPWLEVVSAFSWSNLVTSAIDSTWVEAFRNEWRQLRPLYEEAHRPDQPRNKLELVCILLFGSARWHDTSPVPLDTLELRARRGAATSLVRRIPDLVTPRGVLAIEGYGPSDWLSADILMPSLVDLGENQAHLFSVTEELAALEDVQLLVERGILVLHTESLATAIQSGVDTGVIKLGFPLTGAETGHRIELPDRVLDVPRDLWRRVSRTGYILEDDVLQPPKHLSRASRYQAFRRFLEFAEGKPDWQGYSRGFAFARDFEAPLLARVESALAAKQLQDRPIILHGATGTGKTIALAHLAHNIRHGKRYPVFYIPHRIKPPVFDDMEAFVRWCEGAGASAVLIIWDGMTSYDEYNDLVRLMISRGRKAVVVGSLYRQDEVDQNHFIEVPRELNSNEAERFDTYLRSVDPEIAEASPASGFKMGAQFLVSLYRLLPPSRFQLRVGVAREVGFAEALMSSREREGTITVTARTAMEIALADAGLLDDLPPLLSKESQLAGERVENVQRLTGFVMVPGQFNLSVPLELLLRALGRVRYENFLRILEGADVFQWEEDQNGNIDIGPRTALEAQIITQSRLGGPEAEVRVLCDLVQEMTLDSITPGGSREAEFVSRVAQALDSTQAAGKYERHFDLLADALQRLRTERSIRIPQLMLQEGHMRREWARRAEGTADPASRLEALDQAQEVLEVALEEEQDRYRHNYMRVNLMTELASTLATMARLLIVEMQDRPAALSNFTMAKVAIHDAQRLAPDTYYPLDVMAWATMGLIETGLLQGDAEVDAIAELITALEIADISDFGRSAEQILRRRVQVGQLFGATRLENDSYEALLQRGSSSGILLRALEIAGGPRQDDWAPEGARAAHDFAASEARKLNNGFDQRLREMLLNFWWVSRAGERPFARERVALAFGQDDWVDALALVQRALSQGQSVRTIKLLFLRGLAEFHLNAHAQALETLREVERESFGIKSRWNVVRSYLVSSNTGAPRVFHGVVAEAIDGGMRGDVAVEGIQQRIPFRARDFGSGPYYPGDTLPAFHIAFSYQGPIADPISAYVVARDRERMGRSQEESRRERHRSP